MEIESCAIRGRDVIWIGIYSFSRVFVEMLLVCWRVVFWDSGGWSGQVDADDACVVEQFRYDVRKAQTLDVHYIVPDSVRTIT